jgi:hypothetical protein
MDGLRMSGVEHGLSLMFEESTLFGTFLSILFQTNSQTKTTLFTQTEPDRECKEFKIFLKF